MKVRAILLGVALAVAALTPSAEAATTPLGTLSAGANGSKTFTAADSYWAGLIEEVFSGALTSGTSITFTYAGSAANANGWPTSALLADGLDVTYQNGVKKNGKPKWVTREIGTQSPYYTPTLSEKDGLITGMANLGKDYLSGTVTITNLTSSLLYFRAIFDAWVSYCSKGFFTVSWNVTSAVPLPAALPLFGAGLASLVGAGLRKRRMKKAA